MLHETVARQICPTLQLIIRLLCTFHTSLMQDGVDVLDVAFTTTNQLFDARVV